MTFPPPTLRVFPSFILMMDFGLFYSEDHETLSRNVSRNRFKLSVPTFLTPSQTQCNNEYSFQNMLDTGGEILKTRHLNLSHSTGF